MSKPRCFAAGFPPRTPEGIFPGDWVLCADGKKRMVDMVERGDWGDGVRWRLSFADGGWAEYKPGQSV